VGTASRFPPFKVLRSISLIRENRVLNKTTIQKYVTKFSCLGLKALRNFAVHKLE